MPVLIQTYNRLPQTVELFNLESTSIRNFITIYVYHSDIATALAVLHSRDTLLPHPGQPTFTQTFTIIQNTMRNQRNIGHRGNALMTIDRLVHTAMQYVMMHANNIPLNYDPTEEPQEYTLQILRLILNQRMVNFRRFNQIPNSLPFPTRQCNLYLTCVNRLQNSYEHYAITNSNILQFWHTTAYIGDFENILFCTRMYATHTSTMHMVARCHHYIQPNRLENENYQRNLGHPLFSMTEILTEFRLLIREAIRDLNLAINEPGTYDLQIRHLILDGSRYTPHDPYRVGF